MFVPWWNYNYRFRKKITITAASKNVPAGYLIDFTEDSAAYYTAGLLRSDRNDWRIVYWDGETNHDLYRDYINAAKTIFSVQASISASGSDAGYYLYYGKLFESTSKQPSSNADWLKAYAVFGESPDANTSEIWIPSSSTSTLYGRKNGNNGTIYNYASSSLIGLKEDGPSGRYLRFQSDINGYTNRMYVELGNIFDGNGGMTVEALVRPLARAFEDGGVVISKWQQDDLFSSNAFNTQVKTADGVINTGSFGTGSSQESATGGSTPSNVWKWVAMTYATNPYLRVYVSNSLANERTTGISGGMRTPSTGLQIGQTRQPRYNMNGDIAIIRLSNTPRTSFPYAETLTDPPTYSLGALENVPVGGSALLF